MLAATFVVACFALLSPLVAADGFDCTLTLYHPGTTTLTSTKYIEFSKTTTIPSWTATATSQQTITTYSTIAYRFTTTSGTVIVGTTTSTLPAVSLVTSTCPAGPSYVRHCPTWVSTTTSFSPLFEKYVSMTKTISTTYYFIRYSDLRSTTVTLTKTTGTPKTTTTVTSVQTQNTTTLTSPYTSTYYVGGPIITTSTKYTATTTHIKSFTSPTATATVHLFSLQITNTSADVDGYTIGPAGDASVETSVQIQNSTVFRYYIEPSTHYLTESKTKARMGVTTECEGEECFPPLQFIPVDYQWNGDDFDEVVPLKAKLHSCGSLVTLYTGTVSNGDYTEYSLAYEGGDLYWAMFSDPFLMLLAVGPTKGRQTCSSNEPNCSAL